MKVYKDKHEMNEGDMVAGVVYAAAAEQMIRGQFDVMDEEGGKSHQPTVIGYMVRVDDIDAVVEMENDEQWGLKGGVDDAKVDTPLQVDLDRETVLRNKRMRTDFELKELAAIYRRLGYDVTV